MKLGISSYTYTWAVGVPGYPVDRPLSALELLDKAENLGVSVVQVADNLPLESLSKRMLNTLKAEAASRGIQIEVGTRGIQAIHLAKYLELAKLFHSSILRVVIDTAEYHPAIPKVIDLITESLPAFEAAGICLAIENHDRFSVVEFVRVLEAINSPFLGICLDTVNSFGALEGPEVVVEVLGPWTVNLHIKDFNIRRADHMMGFVIEGTPAGKGRLNIPWLLKELAQHKRDFNAILELWTPPEGKINSTIGKEAAWAQESIHYLKKYIFE